MLFPFVYIKEIELAIELEMAVVVEEFIEFPLNVYASLRYTSCEIVNN